MKVKFIKSHHLYAYFVGDEAEIADASELVAGGYVEEIKVQKVEPKAEVKAEVKQELKGKRK